MPMAASLLENFQRRFLGMEKALQVEEKNFK
jgi:hypothetical protein